MKKTMNRRLLSAFAICSLVQAPALAAEQKEQQSSLEERLAPPPGGGLTSDQVAQRAEDTSYDAAARREAVRAAEAKVDQALVGYWPKLTLTARYARLSPIAQPSLSNLFGSMMGAATTPVVFPVFLDQTLFQGTLNIPVSDYVLRISQGYASASHSQKAAVLDEEAAKLNVALNSRLTYYSWLRAQAQVIVAERTLDQFKAHLEDAHHAFDVGTASKADVLGVEAQVANSELGLEQARSLVTIAEDQIRIAMHDPSGRPYAIGEDLRSEVAPIPGLENLAALRAEALDRRLEVRALDETAWSLREQAKVAKAGMYPRIDAFGDVIYANPNTRYFPPDGTFKGTWDVGVQLVWTPNDTFASKGAASETNARAAQTEMQKAQFRDSVKLEVMQAYQSLRTAEVALGTTRRGLVSAEEAYRVRRELFRNGRATSVELTDSEVALVRASLEAINARVDLRSSRARLVHALGRDIPGSPAR
jgi:outer membrane protein